jgi:hypothetical protein
MSFLSINTKEIEIEIENPVLHINYMNINTDISEENYNILQLIKTIINQLIYQKIYNDNKIDPRYNLYLNILKNNYINNIFTTYYKKIQKFQIIKIKKKLKLKLIDQDIETSNEYNILQNLENIKKLYFAEFESVIKELPFIEKPLFFNIDSYEIYIKTVSSLHNNIETEIGKLNTSKTKLDIEIIKNIKLIESINTDIKLDTKKSQDEYTINRISEYNTKNIYLKKYIETLSR